MVASATPQQVPANVTKVSKVPIASSRFVNLHATSRMEGGVTLVQVNVCVVATLEGLLARSQCVQMIVEAQSEVFATLELVDAGASACLAVTIVLRSAAGQNVVSTVLVTKMVSVNAVTAFMDPLVHKRPAQRTARTADRENATPVLVNANVINPGPEKHVRLELVNHTTVMDMEAATRRRLNATVILHGLELNVITGNVTIRHVLGMVNVIPLQENADANGASLATNVITASVRTLVLVMETATFMRVSALVTYIGKVRHVQCLNVHTPLRVERYATAMEIVSRRGNVIVKLVGALLTATKKNVLTTVATMDSVTECWVSADVIRGGGTTIAVKKCALALRMASVAVVRGHVTLKLETVHAKKDSWAKDVSLRNVAVRKKLVTLLGLVTGRAHVINPLGHANVSLPIKDCLVKRKHVQATAFRHRAKARVTLRLDNANVQQAGRVLIATPKPALVVVCVINRAHVSVRLLLATASKGSVG